MTTLLIARHGNTFDAGDTVLRVGLKTDLPLSKSGRLQAENLGKFLSDNKLIPAQIFTSSLKRTIETATIATSIAQIKTNIIQEHIFDEIDYGPDEGKAESDVIARLGNEALQAWDRDAIVPPGWNVDPQQIINNWHNFAKRIQQQFPDQTILVVTSNGIARFAPYLTGDFSKFCNEYNIKLSTGALCALHAHNDKWQVGYWNKKI